MICADRINAGGGDGSGRGGTGTARGDEALEARVPARRRRAVRHEIGQTRGVVRIDDPDRRHARGGDPSGDAGADGRIAAERRGRAGDDEPVVVRIVRRGHGDRSRDAKRAVRRSLQQQRARAIRTARGDAREAGRIDRRDARRGGAVHDDAAQFVHRQRAHGLD